MKKWFQYEGECPEKFKERKSTRYFRQEIGGKPYGRRVFIWEFENLADVAKFFIRLEEDEEYNELIREWQALIDPNTRENTLWRDLNRDLWIEK